MGASCYERRRKNTVNKVRMSKKSPVSGALFARSLLPASCSRSSRHGLPLSFPRFPRQPTSERCRSWIAGCRGAGPSKRSAGDIPGSAVLDKCSPTRKSSLTNWCSRERLPPTKVFLGTPQNEKNVKGYSLLLCRHWGIVKSMQTIKSIIPRERTYVEKHLPF